MKKTKWFDRKFPAIEDNGLLPGIIERLAGAPVRAEDLVRRARPELLSIKPGEKWSIKEEIGHLGDVEPLWMGRLDDFANTLPELRAADLSNQKTHQANHNAADVKITLQNFREQREKFVSRLRTMSEQQLQHSCMHPRLKTPMRVIDLAYFVAEHDDHHFAEIHELMQRK